MATSESPKRWESRGETLTILIDIGLTYGLAITVVLAISIACFTYSALGSKEPCSLLDAASPMSTREQVFCWYMESHLQCFSTACEAALVLILLRDLLQKRFYYGMLKMGCAIDFRPGGFLKDPLVRLLLWDLFHLVIFYGFLVHVLAQYSQPHSPSRNHVIGSFIAGTYRNVEDPSIYTDPERGPVRGIGGHMYGSDRGRLSPESTTTTSLKASSSNVDIGLKEESGDDAVVMITKFFFHNVPKELIWIPILTLGVIMFGLVVLFKIYGRYDIELHLVGLSEFIAGEGTADEGEAGLSKIVVLEDTPAKVIVDQHTQGIVGFTGKRSPGSPRDTLEKVYSSILALWSRDKLEHQALAPPMNLVDSLWPGHILLALKFDDSSSRWFRYLSAAIIFLSCVCLFCVATFLAFQIKWLCLELPWAAFIGIIPKAIHFGMLGYVAWSIGQCTQI